MKPLHHRIALLANLILAAVLLYQTGLAPRITGEARAQVKARPPVTTHPRLDFNQGIGFYAYSDGKLIWLQYPTTNRENIRNETMPIAKNDFHLYAYGLDFSSSVFGLPPHMMDFAVIIRNTQLNLDNPDYISRDFERRHGPYAVHFKPLEGYDQPVYEITCDLWDAIKAKSSDRITWGFKVKSGENESTHGVFWFSFKSDTNEPNNQSDQIEQEERNLPTPQTPQTLQTPPTPQNTEEEQRPQPE